MDQATGCSTSVGHDRKSSQNQYEMQDPTKQYPGAEFSEQRQPPPGLAREMEPKPDHGEQSYQGFGRLKGRRALITGADSGIGRAVAIAFAREGADVALNYLPSEKPDAQEVIALIETAGRKAVALAGDIRDEGFCSQLVADSLGSTRRSRPLGECRWAPAGPREHRRHHHRAVRRDVQDERLRDVLAVQGGTASHGGGRGHHQHRLDPVVLAFANDSRLRLDQGRDRRVYQGPGPSRSPPRVSASMPWRTGPVWTPLQTSGGQPPEKIPHFGGQVPLGRPGQPAELAPVYVFLPSQESSYVTGEVYGVTGGNPLP